MLEKAKAVTGKSGFTYIEYARFADDLVILVDGYRRWNCLLERAYLRLLEELARLDVKVNEEKTRVVDLTKGESFSFLGFDTRRITTLSGKWGVRITPRMKARTNLLRNLKEIFQRFMSQPVERVIELINPKLRGWVNYFRIGHSSRCFSYVKDWVEKKIRRHLMRSRKRKGTITLVVKPKGKHSAGNPHAMFDEAGTGDVQNYSDTRHSSTLLTRGNWR
jgi:RNA-directed DNA polymerase